MQQCKLRTFKYFSSIMNIFCIIFKYILCNRLQVIEVIIIVNQLLIATQAVRHLVSVVDSVYLCKVEHNLRET